MTIGDMLAQGMRCKEVDEERVRMNAIPSFRDGAIMIAFALGQNKCDLLNVKESDLNSSSGG